MVTNGSSLTATSTVISSNSNNTAMLVDSNAVGPSTLQSSGNTSGKRKRDSLPDRVDASKNPSNTAMLVDSNAVGPSTSNSVTISLDIVSPTLQLSDTSSNSANDEKQPTYIPPKEYLSEFHRTAFMARAAVHTTSQDQEVPANAIVVDAVKLSNDRPPTQFGNEGQRSHLVPWVLSRQALEGLSGRSVEDIVKIIAELTEHTEVSKEQSAKEAGTTLKAILDQKLKEGRYHKRTTWQTWTSELLRIYVSLLINFPAGPHVELGLLQDTMKPATCKSFGISKHNSGRI
ncbi:MAG: hypothetical protein R3E79_53030 [Caldilineaceae bacterium]